MARRILIVDDEAGVRDALSLLLEEGGYVPLTASSGEAALGVLAGEAVDLVLSDVAMPGMDGIALVEQIRRLQPDLPVIMVSAHGELETAVRAVRAGAYDYLVKPVDEDRLLHTLERALEMRRLRSDYGVLREEARAEGEMIGDSPPMRRLREEISRAAPSEGRILVLGENGTGKEMVARLVHDRSRRRDRPFVKVNSAAIPKDLIESELFGHEAGAFTGATKPRRGKLELADGGSLFLDEIADMALDAQAKLLRVLSTGELERVGGGRAIPFDVRLITASNRDLLEEIRTGRFREDLYHRIAVIPLRVPPLRERGSDITLLAQEFLRRYSAGYRESPPRLEETARQVLLRHPWPGNVRQLRNLMERIAIMHPRDTVNGTDLEALLPPEEVGRAAPPVQREDAGTAKESRKDEQAAPSSTLNRTRPPSAAAQPVSTEEPAEDLRSALQKEERAITERVLHETGWNVTLAAERLGIDRASLHRKMRRLGIRRPGRPRHDS